MTGGQVARVVVHPLSISRTDLAHNPHPLIVVWAGPVVGVFAPLLLWSVACAIRLPGAFVLRFFAGFCLMANGLYIGIGTFNRVGDCGEMLRHGSQRWHLWLFGAVAVSTGLWLWHNQGSNFGLGPAQGRVSRVATYVALTVCLALLVIGFSVGGE